MYIDVSTTIGCKNRCKYCPQETVVSEYQKKTLGGGTRVMTLEMFKIFIDKLPKKMTICFAGFSEPFLNPKGAEMILATVKKKHPIRLYTTLIGLTLKNLKKILREVNFDGKKNKLYLHLPSEEPIEAFGTDKKYLKLLEYLLSKKIKITNLHYHGQKLNREVMKLVRKYHYRVGRWWILPRPGRAGIRGIDPTRKKRGIISCPLLRKHGHELLPDGTVALCCMDYEIRHVLGSLAAESYANIRRSRELSKIRSGLADDKLDILCRSCYFSKGVNGLAIYDSTDPSLKKVLLGIKLLSYNKLGVVYKALRRVKRIIFPAAEKRDGDKFLKM